ncbi:uncharacterized protein MELLADRAFT_76240 [Melampsora larici-populina 98AG31]|uniref:Uncharacterized protein n=1 Tax=Melampsora larici-populina (strain 98AG31 / pathotype 3-4-7) TaxID=747676 RepID=F4R3D2_MELLP|nr:uncharacterized protein MELLADRAFT_76240 [Melampsora larici-populina 98AG31]EGG12608.1 hypothetical protein MELLADRAFT_76240 [Melampsora larici-populina 98AG31]
MNFAPYAPPPDEHRQGTSPKLSRKPSSPSTSARSPSSSMNKSHHEPNPWKSYQSGGVAGGNPINSNQYTSQQNQPNFQSSQSHSGLEAGPSNQSNAFQSSTNRLEPGGQFFPSPEAYETRFGWRVDLLSALSYCTPLMAILMLIVETRNDFVRIHAYQSLLIALPLAFLHFIFLASHFFQVLLFLIDLGLYGWLGYQAYFDAEVLERKLLPHVGPLAERWTEEE